MPLTTILVDTTLLLVACIASVSPSPQNAITRIALDLEGVELSRIGKASLLQLLAENSSTIWVVDLTVLGHLAFDHTDSEGRSLRQILESSATQKLLYDVRMDADALYHLFGVNLANVLDLQVLEVASRRSRNLKVRLVRGLGAAIQDYLSPPADWLRVKDAGAALSFPDKGGSYEVFEQRPLDARILAYSAQDVALLFDLRDAVQGKMGAFGKNWEERVNTASAARVREAYGPYTGRGQHRALAPNI